MRSMINVDLELISGPDIHLFFERGMRDGVSCFLRDIAKTVISIWYLMTQNKDQNIFYF